jgi:hypothetical protein
LQLSNSLNGLLFTVVISKELKSIYHEEKPEHIKQSLVSWSSKKAHEKLLRIRDFFLLILLGLGKEGQDVLWVTDNDDIVANTNQLSSINKFMKETLLKHLDYRLGNFSIITLSDDSEERTLEKLCSIPDLIAGALIDFIGDYENENKMPKNVGDVEPPINHEKMKVNPITKWLSKDEHSHNLKKVTITIKNKVDEDGLEIKTFRFPEFYSKLNV